MKKNILMLCYYYPPANNGGTERSVKFVQYLPDFDWIPVVITTQAFGQTDAKKEKIIRTPELTMLFRRAPFKRMDAVAVSHPRHPKISFWRDLIILDPQIGWGIFAFWSALKQIYTQPIAAIFSTSPPVSSHLLALFLKWVTGKSWVMDLRDPWTFEPISYYMARSPRRIRNEQRIERLCFRHADQIILNTPQALQRYQALYPEFAAKMQTITNGFDSQEMQEAQKISLELFNNLDDHTFIISHTGHFERRPNPEVDGLPREFLNAIQNLLISGIIKREKLRVIFAGGPFDLLKRLVNEMALQDVVIFPGQLSHLEALCLIQRSNLLLLYDPFGDGQSYVRGKLYEYLGSGNPILGIVPDGASRDLLLQIQKSWLVYPQDIGGTQTALRQALENRLPMIPPSLDLTQYERRNLTAQLAHLLDLSLAHSIPNP